MSDDPAADTASDDHTISDPPETLAHASRAIVSCAMPTAKVERARQVAKAWFGRRLATAHLARPLDMPLRPGRPVKPVLGPPREMVRRSTKTERGRFALLHALAHIELNAVDMTWDLVGRFAHQPMPRGFFDDWVQVGLEEAKHFDLLARRLEELGGAYGDLPAHDGLWQAAQATGHDLLARLTVVPLILEARGLDVTPRMIEELGAAGDQASAKIIEIIYRDEKRHVAFGMKWFRFLCERGKLPLEATFHRLVRDNFRGSLKPPFNEAARTAAGLTPGFYKPLTAFGAPA